MFSRPSFEFQPAQYIFWASLIFLASIAGVPLLYCLGASVFIISAYKVFYHQPIKFIRAGLLLVICGLAWITGQYRQQSYPIDTSTIPYDENSTFEAVVTQPPRIAHANQKLYVLSPSVPGKIYVKTGRYPEYKYGDTLQITCTLQKPEPIEDFAFDTYLARYGVYSICVRPQIKNLQRFSGQGIFKLLYDIRNRVRSEIKTVWPEPVASLLLGVILGIQDDIPDGIVQQFRITGTIHILVVSGMHVMIIAQLLASFGLRWFSRKSLFWIVLAVLIGFCIITGLAASVIRATIMGVLPILARSYGRQPIMHYSLAFVAASMVAWNPYILLYDAGFQLSFLATLGLIYFQPLMQRCCWWLPTKFGLQETLSTTLAATIPTTPFILYTFGSVSLISPLTNMLVVPVSTFMLFAGTGVIIVDQFIPALAHYWAYIVWQIVTWMLEFVQWCSQLSFAYVNNISAPIWSSYCVYALIIFYIIWQIPRPKSAR